MRVRMLNPSSKYLELINRDTFPVRIDINVDGFPEAPVFRWHAQALDQNPWIRRRFGHFVLIDPVREEVFGVAYGPRLQTHLERLVKSYYETRQSREVARVPGPPDSANEVMPDHLKGSFLDPMFMTAYELSFDTWTETVDLIADGSQLAPGVRNLAIHAIANLLNAEEGVRYLKHCRSLGIVIQEHCGLEVRERNDVQDTVLPDRPLDLLERAAVSLVRIAGLPIHVEDPDLVAKVRSWWSEHAKDETYRVEYSEDPSLRYAFLR